MTGSPTHVETELQRLVSRRLDPASHDDQASGSRRGSRSMRSRMQRKTSIASAFDSPQGFVFVADVGHKKG